MIILINETLLLTAFLFSYKASLAQKIINRDMQIEQMVGEVSPDSLKAYINKMVSFGTSNT